MIHVGVSTQNRDHTTAYFYCPRCHSRKPCVQGSETVCFCLFFLPLLPVGTRGEYYRCEGCQGFFDPEDDFPYDLGDHANPKLWTCSRCHSTNPSHAFRCQVCGWDG